MLLSDFYRSCRLQLAVAASCLLPSLLHAQTTTYSGPLVITQGGTYTGNYQSLTSGTPCILVNTTQPVVLDGCNLQGAGHLIQSGSGANLTVRNCRGTALTPTVDGQPAGHFLDTYQSQSLTVEHNYFSGTTGITVNRWSGSSGTLTVRYNQARNIDGRWRNNGGSSRSSFLQLNTVNSLAGVEIAYNEVINTPNQSLVEDNINFYNSSGTSGSPIRVHDNFVRGAYPYPATAATFTGTGLTTDGDASTFGLASGYIEASGNQFVATCNAAMNIAAGHDVYYHDNRLVTSALLPDGTRLNATYAATAIFNYYQQAANLFFNNRVTNTTVGYVKWGANNPYADRQDLSPGSCATCTGITSLPNPITLATEDNEYSLWQQKVQQAGLTLGPLTGQSTTPAPATTAGTIANAGFEADGTATQSPSGWQTTPGPNTDASADYTETYLGAHSGQYHLTHYRPTPFAIYTYQTVTGLANGTYTLSVWTRGTGAITALLMARNYGGAEMSAPVPASPTGWVQVTVPNIVVSNGQLELGVYSKGNAGNWLYFDDFSLVPSNAPPTVSLAASTTTPALGQALTLTAAAADTDGTVAKVAFYAGTTKLGEASTAPYQLAWTPASAGTYALTAVATDNAGASTTSAAVSVTVTAAAATGTGNGLLANAGFEADGTATQTPSGWQTTPGANTDANADYTETYPGAHSGQYHLTHYRPAAYEVYTYQVVRGLPNGTYSLTAWVRSSGGQNTAQLQAKNYGGPALAAAIGATGGDWVQVQLSNIVVSNGQLELGAYSNANAGNWLYVDDVAIALQSAMPTASNQVLNPGFEDDQAAVLSPRSWTTQASGTTSPSTSYSESFLSSHSGTYHGTHYSLLPYEVYTYQVVKNLPAGTYNLKVWVRGGSHSLAQLQAKSYGGPALAVDIPNSPGQWTQISILGLNVSNGQCEIGFYSKDQGGQWFYYDDVELVQQSTPTASTSSVSTDDSAASSTALYPNPADGQTTLSVAFSQADKVVISVLDYQGIQVAQYQRGASVGDNQFVLDTSSLPNGSYTVRLTSSSQSPVSLRLAVAH